MSSVSNAGGLLGRLLDLDFDLDLTTLAGLSDAALNGCSPICIPSRFDGEETGEDAASISLLADLSLALAFFLRSIVLGIESKSSRILSCVSPTPISFASACLNAWDCLTGTYRVDGSEGFRISLSICNGEDVGRPLILRSTERPGEGLSDRSSEVGAAGSGEEAACVLANA